ncbi:MAG: type II toxin-antitoxin system VapC family toxin [Actinomycetota bacterium]
MQGSKVVLDASVVLRATVDRSTAAVSFLERVRDAAVEASWPDLLFVEVANGVATLARAGRVTERTASQVLAFTLAAPVRVVSVLELVVPALAVAGARSLSVYDACYVVLAEATDSTLVTADRRLATATANAHLLVD